VGDDAADRLFAYGAKAIQTELIIRQQILGNSLDLDSRLNRDLAHALAPNFICVSTTTTTHHPHTHNTIKPPQINEGAGVGVAGGRPRVAAAHDAQRSPCVAHGVAELGLIIGGYKERDGVARLPYAGPWFEFAS
jgi:hypothetical protein